MRWLEFQKQLQEELTNEYVETIFRKHLITQLEKLKKKHPTATFMFCKDERQQNVWRKDIYPEYKATRGFASDFIHHLHGVMIEIVSQMGRVYASPRLEADDIAFLLVKKLRSHHPDADIIILTSDRDYLQMTDEKVRLLDGPGKWIVGSGDAQKDLWIKIIMGDKSDNIPAIAKGCGKKTAEILATNPTKLQEFVAKHKCQAELDRNKTLVCMDQIPLELREAFYENGCDL